MKKFLNVLIFVTIFVPLTWTIYVPEYTRNYIKADDSGYYVSKKQAIREKTLRRDLHQRINKNPLKLGNNDDDENDVKRIDDQRILFSTNAHQQLPILRQQKSYDKHESLEAQPTGLGKQQQSNIQKNNVLKATIGQNEYHNTLQHQRHRRQLSDFLIAPNTRWCGRGNTANGTYNHLGGASVADKCCRTHDHCKVYIPAMSNRYELFNYRPYTMSHCNCDRRFRTCLKMANDEDAKTIGKLFFNLVQTQCFVLTKEVICLQRAKDGNCLKEHVKQKAYLRNNKKY